MGEKLTGLKVEIEEGSKITTIPMGDEVKQYFNNQKSYLDYIKEFLIRKKYFDQAMSALENSMYEALPESVKKNCKHCNGQNVDVNDQLCDRFYVQMHLSFIIVANEFVKIVVRSKHIYKNKKVVLNLTEQFFNCIYIERETAILLFDLDKLSRYLLNAGFLSISRIFSNSEALKNLKTINQNLDQLDQWELENKVLEKKDDNFIGLQKEFFERKRIFYKEQLFIEQNEIKKTSNKKAKSKTKNRPTIVHHVLYYHYLQQSKDYPFFENHPYGKLEAIKELLVESKIETTQKYFQKTYNFYCNHYSNRIARNQIENIKFVANNMLKGFPEAKKKALEELNLANN